MRLGSFVFVHLLIVSVPCLGFSLIDDTGKDEIVLPFPKSIAGLTYNDKSTYDSPGLGYSVHYIDETPIKADIYIYNNNVEDIPTGCDNDQVKSEADLIRETLYEAVNKKIYRNIKHIKSIVYPESSNIQFISEIYEYIKDENTDFQGMVISNRYITGFLGSFVKIRITYDKKNAKIGDKTSKLMVNEITNILVKSDLSRRKKEAKEILSEISKFYKDPAGDKTAEARLLIFSYCRLSDDVYIPVVQGLSPWLSEDIDNSDILFVAYMSGCIKPQLIKLKKGDYTYEGLLQVIEIYQKMRKKKEVEKVEDIEKWIKLKRSGKIKKYVADIIKKIESESE